MWCFIDYTCRLKLWWLDDPLTQSVHVCLNVHIFMHILFIAYMYVYTYVRPYLLNTLRIPIARHHPEGSVAGLSEVIKGWFCINYG